MKKRILLLSVLIVAVAVPDFAAAKKLVLDIPPIWAGRNSTQNTCSAKTECTGSIFGDFCCEGVCTTEACPESCSTNTNCTASEYGTYCCGDGDKVCTATPCPESCSANTNCAGSEYGEFCCEGVCATEACPESCSDNNSCSSSQYGDYCCDGFCTATPCPESCTTNTNCATSEYGTYCCGDGDKVCTTAPCPESCEDNNGCLSSEYGTNCCNGKCQEESDCGPTGLLNDTGIVDTVGATGQEDADKGRDVTHNEPSDGHAGFSFTSDGDCSVDTVTGLTWSEHKGYPADNPTQPVNWFDSDGVNDIIVAANTAPGLCGRTNWRLPTVKELVGVVAYNKAAGPTVDGYLTDTASNLYWTETADAATADAADPKNQKRWVVNFSNGMITTSQRDNGTSNYVRLVHE